MTPTTQPPNPLHAMTPAHLAGRRHQLERAIAFFDAQDPVPAARADLQAALEGVLAEQDDRARIAGA